MGVERFKRLTHQNQVSQVYKYLVSLFVGWGGGQSHGAQVCRCCVIVGQFRAQGLVGDLDLRPQVFQDVIDFVLRDGLSMPVIKILDIYSQGMKMMNHIQRTEEEVD